MGYNLKKNTGYGFPMVSQYTSPHGAHPGDFADVWPMIHHFTGPLGAWQEVCPLKGIQLRMIQCLNPAGPRIQL